MGQHQAFTLQLLLVGRDYDATVRRRDVIRELDIGPEERSTRTILFGQRFSIPH